MVQAIKERWLPLLLIVSVGALLRFVWLDRIPSAIGGDELVYILEAKSVALTGKDLSGVWNPLSIFLFKYPPDERQAELPYLINLPVVGMTQFSLLTARVTYAVLSVLTIVGLYLFVREFFNTNVAIASAFIAAINPWQIYIGRTAYDMVPAVCFYLWAMYITIVRRGKMLLWSLPLYMLAFYSYIGTKIILLPIILVMSLYVIKEFPDRQNKKKIGILLCIVSIFLGFFIYSLFATRNPTRLSEIISLSDPVISQTVDTIRKVSIRSSLVDVYVNKYTILSSIVLTKLSRVFSSDYLFAYGDQFFSLYTHGLFYFIDAFFLLAGMITMFARYKRKMLFICLFTIIGIIPHLIHSLSTEDFTPHLVMMFPFLIIFIGYGIYEIVQRAPQRYRKYLLFIIIGLYGLSLGNFFQIYWFQHSLSGQFDFPIRVMSKYLQIQKKDSNVLVYSTRTKDMYKKYLFYSNSIQKENMSAIREALASNNIQINNISFLGCDRNLVIPPHIIVIYDSECGSLSVTDEFLKIRRLKDGGEEFRIYNDPECLSYNLKPYPGNFSLKDLEIERLSTQAFCETYVTR